MLQLGGLWSHGWITVSGRRWTQSRRSAIRNVQVTRYTCMYSHSQVFGMIWWLAWLQC